MLTPILGHKYVKFSSKGVILEYSSSLKPRSLCFNVKRDNSGVFEVQRDQLTERIHRFDFCIALNRHRGPTN